MDLGNMTSRVLGLIRDQTSLGERDGLGFRLRIDGSAKERARANRGTVDLQDAAAFGDR